MRRAIVAVEVGDGRWMVEAGYVMKADWTSHLSGPSSTGITWIPGSPVHFRTSADVDWDTVPKPMQALDVAPKMVEP